VTTEYIEITTTRTKPRGTMRKYEDTTVAMMDENKRVAPTVQVMFDLSQRKPIDGSKINRHYHGETQADFLVISEGPNAGVAVSAM
jgi:hypothetical protein